MTPYRKIVATIICRDEDADDITHQLDKDLTSYEATTVSWGYDDLTPEDEDMLAELEGDDA